MKNSPLPLQALLTSLCVQYQLLTHKADATSDLMTYQEHTTYGKGKNVVTSLSSTIQQTLVCAFVAYNNLIAVLKYLLVTVKEVKKHVQSDHVRFGRVPS